MKNVVWIKGYEGIYSITQDGKVYSHKYNGKDRKKPLKKKAILLKNGYYVYGLYKNKKDVKEYMHRLLAIHFIPNPDEKLCVNHKNGKKTDNHISNLEWVTKKENNLHAIKNGLSHSFQGSEPGERCPSSRLTDKTVLKIRSLYPNVKSPELGKRYGVTAENIMLIVNRKTWNHI